MWVVQEEDCLRMNRVVVTLLVNHMMQLEHSLVTGELFMVMTLIHGFQINRSFLIHICQILWEEDLGLVNLVVHYILPCLINIHYIRIHIINSMATVDQQTILKIWWLKVKHILAIFVKVPVYLVTMDQI